jgi:LysM repeat protein
LNRQQNIWKGFQLQGRHFATKFGIGILLALLATAFMTSVSVMGIAHAATIESYTIVSGDTLSGIASRFGVSVSDLEAANSIADPDLIYAGQTIQIPGSDGGSAATSNTTSQLGGSYVDMIHQVFGPYGDQATNIAMCESSLNPDAYNGILGATGLFQIIPGTWASTSYAGDSAYDPAANIQAAHEIFARDGYAWSEWQCQP